LPGATEFCRTHKNFAKKLENEERGQNFPADTSIFAKRPKKG